MERLKPFVTDGLLHWRGDRAVVTPVGRYFLRSIAATFDAYLVTTDAGRAMSRAV
jgi:coproporphyrinogen III oxidase-like Fe-S oxidoreductase